MGENIDEQWDELLQTIQERFGREPNMEAVLFIIGLQETGQLKTRFTKEEKQDLMHIAVCTLLSKEGFYVFTDRDKDGWPHFEPVKHVEVIGKEEQEQLLKKQAIDYFNN